MQCLLAIFIRIKGYKYAMKLCIYVFGVHICLFLLLFCGVVSSRIRRPFQNRWNPTNPKQSPSESSTWSKLKMNEPILVSLREQDYYSLLGATRSSSTSDIKTAYREKAMRMHPDKGGDTEQFKQLNEAYETLIDTKKRSLYDRLGHTQYKSINGANAASATADSHSNAQTSYFYSTTNQYDSDIFRSDFARDLFNRFRSATNNNNYYNRNFFYSSSDSDGYSNSNSNSNRSPPLVFALSLSLEDLFYGRQIELDISKYLASTDSKLLRIDIPAGSADGSFVSLPQTEIIYNIRQGKFSLKRDLMFRIQQQSHPIFTRVQNDLFMELNISLTEYLFGIWNREINGIDGKQLVLSTIEKKPAVEGTSASFGSVTNSNSNSNTSVTSSMLSLDDWYEAKGEGMPINSNSNSNSNNIHKRGSLFIRFVVSLPTENAMQSFDKKSLQQLQLLLNRLELIDQNESNSNSPNSNSNNKRSSDSNHGSHNSRVNSNNTNNNNSNANSSFIRLTRSKRKSNEYQSTNNSQNSNNRRDDNNDNDDDDEGEAFSFARMFFGM